MSRIILFFAIGITSAAMGGGEFGGGWGEFRVVEVVSVVAV